MTKAEAVAKVKATIDEVIRESKWNKWDILEEIDDYVQHLGNGEDDVDFKDDDDELSQWDEDEDE